MTRFLKWALLIKQMLIPDNPGAKRMSYAINYLGGDNQCNEKFKDAEIIFKDDEPYLSVLYDGDKIKERVLYLDAERVKKGEITAEQLIGKYLSHLR